MCKAGGCLLVASIQGCEMSKIFEELKSIPGVLGAFIIHSKDGILIKDMPTIFKEQKLEVMGNSLIKMFSTSLVNFPDTIELSAFYEESVIMIKEITDDFFLIVMYDPTLNLNFLSMSINLMLDDFKKFCNTPNDIDNVNQHAMSTDESGALERDHQISAEEAIETGPMAETLQGMQEALIKILGPMAPIIFNDSVNEWLKNDLPSFSSLSSLIEIINAEIGDSEKAEAYLQRILPLVDQDN